MPIGRLPRAPDQSACWIRAARTHALPHVFVHSFPLSQSHESWSLSVVVGALLVISPSIRDLRNNRDSEGGTLARGASWLPGIPVVTDGMKQTELERRGGWTLIAFLVCRCCCCC